MPPPSSTYAPVANPASDLPDSNALNHSNRNSALLDPESANLLGRPGSEYLPAPSLMSRDSTQASLSILGSPGLGNASRDSWGSADALATAAGGMAQRTSPKREPSALANPYSTDDRTSTSSDDEQGHITPAVAAIGAGAFAASASGDLNEKPKWAEVKDTRDGRKTRRWLWPALGAGAIILICLAVGLGVGLTRNKDHKGPAADDNKKGSGVTGPGATASSNHATPATTDTSGVKGSLIKLDDGTTMTYDNPFGGKWVWDEANPFNNEAQAQSWTPALNQEWTWGKDKVKGVNVGGWLVTEPFIVPGLYEKYASGPAGTAIDEYTLSQNMGNNLTNAMTEHYDTFITERDFAEMASAGINWIRLPIGFWAVETWEGEPFLERKSWEYVLKAIKWCRKYGLRINLDLHSVPGSQNGWNHSGRQGLPNWLNGVMGLANAQRSLDYIRTLAQFIAQPQYAPVVQMFGFINEPSGTAIGKDPIASFYLEAYTMIRDITGLGAGKGPLISMHDSFIGITNWYGYLPEADRLVIDQHTYMVFQDQPQGTVDDFRKLPCQWWAASTNKTSQQFGPNVGGEWSAAWNDCGLWVNNVGSGSRYDGTYNGYADKKTGSCDYWNDYTQWNQSTIDALNHFVLGSMDALQNYFFWTWKIGNSTSGVAEPNPFWHYRLGLQHGWIPKDPREAAGTCEADGAAMNPFDGNFANPGATGGAGAGHIPASISSEYPWPPPSFTNVPSASMSKLPQYTQTGTRITMPGPSYTKPGSSETIDAGNGWFNADAGAHQAYATIADCSYPPEYSAADLQIPNSACGAGLTQPTKRAVPFVMDERDIVQPTPAPKA
nr:glucan 1,3-beta-glucosidase [Cryptococcus depauperatus CBS 7855]